LRVGLFQFLSLTAARSRRHAKPGSMAGSDQKELILHELSWQGAWTQTREEGDKSIHWDTGAYLNECGTGMKTSTSEELTAVAQRTGGNPSPIA
jgi:hypothetical protein